MFGELSGLGLRVSAGRTKMVTVTFWLLCESFDVGEQSWVLPSSEVNFLSRATKERPDSKDSELELEIALSPEGWTGVGRLLTVESGYSQTRQA